MDFPRFKTPSSIAIIGSSQSGKTQLALKILTNPEVLFDRKFDQTFLYYNAYQPLYEKFSDLGVVLRLGVPSFETLQNNQGHTLVILDDMQTQLAKSEDFFDLITNRVHHNNISVLVMIQNLFLKGLRNSRLNLQGLIFMRSAGDKLAIQTIGRQLYPGQSNFFMKAYNDATSQPYSYLIVDLSQKTSENMRLRTRVLPAEWPVVCYATSL